MDNDGVKGMDRGRINPTSSCLVGGDNS